MVIHLHEDAARLSLTDPSLVACANSARILMGWFHQVGALNVDIGVFLCANPSVSFALILVRPPSLAFPDSFAIADPMAQALRTQVRMIAVHEKLGYVGAASAIREDLAQVMDRLRESKTLPMGGASRLAHHLLAVLTEHRQAAASWSSTT